jgi:predicted nucleotidyltransferase
MGLEAQYVAPEEHRQQVAERADGLLRSWSRTLWDDTARADPAPPSVEGVPAGTRGTLSTAMREKLAALRPQILAAAASSGANAVRIFGSAVRGKERPDSDVDFLVTLEPGRSLLDLTRLESALERLLGRRVDVVTEQSLREPIRSTALREAVRV